MKSSLIASAMSIFVAAACGSSSPAGGTPDAHLAGGTPDAGNLPTIDAPHATIDAPSGTTIDAPTSGTIDAPAAMTCEADPSYSGEPMMEQAGSDVNATSMTVDFENYFGALNADTAPDLLDIELYAMTGVFTAAITPGTYTLSGDELNYATCGLCVLIYANATFDSSTGDLTGADQYYLATGGSVTITSVADNTAGTGTLTGTLNNITFDHVTIDSTTFTSTPVGDSCESMITSMPFTAPVTVIPSMRSIQQPGEHHLGVHRR